MKSDKVPYPGLRSFHRGETDIFFGRDDCIDSMVERLAATRLLAVLGSSGTGKSSLAKTGLLSALEKGLMYEAGTRWRFIEFEPSTMPFRNLAKQLIKTEPSKVESSPANAIDPIDQLADFLRRGPRSLIEWCRNGHLAPDCNLLLLVDQFEELFRYQDYARQEAAEAFVELLLESGPRARDREKNNAIAANITMDKSSVPSGDGRTNGPSSHLRGPRIYIVLTMRSEYLAACALIEGLAEAVNAGMYLTPRMTREQCREAIVGPARVRGGRIDKALVNRLLNDLSSFAPWDGAIKDDQLDRIARRADQLPLLQYTLSRMWTRAREIDHRNPVALCLSDYEKIGGLQGAIDSHANEILTRLGTDRYPVAEKVFRALTAGTSVAEAVRRPSRFGSLVAICDGDEAAVRDVVDAFRAPDCNFLVPGADEPLNMTTIVEISHESLIRQWKQLSAWLEKEAQAARLWQRLEDAAESYRRGEGGLLQDRNLDTLVTWHAETSPNAAWASRYGRDHADALSFLAESVQAARKRRRLLRITAVAVGIAIAVALVGGPALFWRYRIHQLELEQRAEIGRLDMEKQTALAESNFRLAVTTADKIVGQISTSLDRGDISIKGAEDLLKTVDQILRGPMPQTSKTEEIRLKLLLTVSDIFSTRRALQEAYRYAKTARTIAEPLLAAEPNNQELLRLVYACSWRMGDALADRGSDPVLLEQALQEYQSAMGMARRLAAMADNSDRKRELMFIHQKIGDIRQQQGKWADAIAEYDSALAVIQSIVRREPLDPRWQSDLANTMSVLGQAKVGNKDFDEALKLYRDAYDIRLELATNAADDDSQQWNLSRSLVDIGRLYEQRNELDKAIAEYKQALQLSERLTKKEPENAEWQTSLASLYASAGAVQEKRKDLASALEFYRKGYLVRQQLAIQDASNPERKENAAVALNIVANLLVAQDRFNEALPLYSDALLILEDLGQEYERRDELDAAFSEYKKALEIRERLAMKDPGNANTQASLASLYASAAAVQEKRKDLASARELFQKARRILKDLTLRDPAVSDDFSNVALQKNFLLAYTRIADFLEATEEPSEALEQYRNALTKADELTVRYPDDPDVAAQRQSLNTKIDKLVLKP